MKKKWTTIQRWPRKIGIGIIRLYQKTLSPDHGPWSDDYMLKGCRYYPSCSEYTAQSIEKHGLAAGSVRGGWRILRCNPWSKGGIDEVK